jgi:Ca2+-transporting ATPase
MRRKPLSATTGIFTPAMVRHILCFGLLMAFVSLGLGYLYWSAGQAQWQTVLFTTVAFSQLGHVLAIRSGSDSIFHIGLLSNKALLAAVLLSLALQLVVLYLPFLQGFFRVQALGPVDLAISLLAASVIFWAVELEKWRLRKQV